ncbi:M23 family metallopeptidase [Arthrobacter sp. I2-34]|uniref:M23 family metallopeptidase n=1 Tax=Arthrobacter hankyongi TaxID=2904801 RepID=A0ABS9L1I1_9MICC|nr:M23 family metallopeptidase [Arthrobacter hankyongi]MCG2620418.1 M23 family metallopeptidase [Arthrobacter hankyongi]
MRNFRPAHAALAALLLACLGIIAAPAAALSPPAAAARPWDGTTAGGYAPVWDWPLQPLPRILAPFRPPQQPWLSGHRGVDLAAVPAATVVAPAAGTVSFAGWVVDRPVVTIDHGDGLRSSFEPVASALRKGDAVARGDPVGQLSGRGHCAGPCIHWGVRRGSQYVNPLQFVTDLRPSVLLPRPPAG